MSNTTSPVRPRFSRTQFTQEFLPTMHLAGRYFTWDEVNYGLDVVGTQVWTVIRQSDNSMIVELQPRLVANGKVEGYLVTEEPYTQGAFASRWWDSEQLAYIEILKWAQKLVGAKNGWGSDWARRVIQRQPLGFKSNITLAQPKGNGWMSGPTKGSSYRVMEEPVMVKSGPEATEQRLHDLEVGDVSQDEHMEYLEGRIDSLEAEGLVKDDKIATLAARLEMVESTLDAFRAVLNTSHR